MRLRPRELALYTGRLLGPAIGLFFIVAAASKALDPVAFAGQIEAYELVSGAALTRAMAWFFIGVETLVGTCLLFGVQRRPALLAAAAMLTLFTGITAWAWARGQQHACGCFGTLVERTPAQTFFEDLVLLACVGLAMWYRPPSRRTVAMWRRWAVAWVAILGMVIPPVIGAYSPALDEGKSLSDLGLEAYLPSDPDARTIYAFLEPLGTGPDYQVLQELAYRGVPVVGLCSAAEEQIEEFRWSAGPPFEVVSVSGPTLRRLSQDRRGAFLVEHGKVTQIWRGTIPDALDPSWGVAAQAPPQAIDTTVDEEVRR
ncbi:MAG: hypothetical protein O7F16_06425 [Acidobacteria bacterium]|nr:hypothetical protein [Acidobacteriota bacterium]